ncbi:MAG: hypothetical protein IIV43_07990 [Oscillospiraceae bacterium]|nr:hypothetical protein [Oscillospiraceae bacterium]
MEQKEIICRPYTSNIYWAVLSAIMGLCSLRSALGATVIWMKMFALLVMIGLLALGKVLIDSFGMEFCFSEKGIVVRRRNKLLREQRWSQLPYLYTMKAKNGLTVLVLSEKPLEDKTVRRLLNSTGAYLRPDMIHIMLTSNQSMLARKISSFLQTCIPHRKSVL